MAKAGAPSVINTVFGKKSRIFERQTRNMVVAGKTNTEIADLLCISARTAEKHRASMMSKLGVRNLPELMAKALQDGLLEQTQ